MNDLESVSLIIQTADVIRKGYLLSTARITCYFDRLNVKIFKIKNFLKFNFV